MIRIALHQSNLMKYLKVIRTSRRLTLVLSAIRWVIMFGKMTRT